MTFEETMKFMDNELREKLNHINITYDFIGREKNLYEFWMKLKEDKHKGIAEKLITTTFSFPIEKKADFLVLMNSYVNNLITMHILPHPIDIENSKSVGEYEI